MFPYRTQKLSSFVLKILGWQRPGTIGWRQHLEESQKCDSFLFLESERIPLSEGFFHLRLLCEVLAVREGSRSKTLFIQQVLLHDLPYSAKQREKTPFFPKTWRQKTLTYP